MIYFSLAFNIILIVVAIAVVAVYRLDAARERQIAHFERDRHERLLSDSRQREDKLLNRIAAPQVTAAQSITEQLGPQQPVHISAFDDEAVAEYENARDELLQSTRDLVTANTEASE